MKKDPTLLEEQNRYGLPEAKILRTDLDVLTSFVVELSNQLNRIEKEVSKLKVVNLV